MDWPQVGTEYEPLFDCKLDLLRVARQSSPRAPIPRRVIAHRPTTFPGNLKLHFATRPISNYGTQIRFGCKAEASCQFEFVLQGRNGRDPNTTWKIVGASFSHSHESDHNEEEEEEIVRRIERFMERIRVAKERSFVEEEEGHHFTLGSEERQSYTLLGSKRPREDIVHDGESEISYEDDSTSEYGSQTGDWFKSHEQTEKAELLESGRTVEFREKVGYCAQKSFLPLLPRPSTSISQLRLQICAAASQRNLKLIINSYEPLHALCLVCSRGSNASQEKKCRFLIKLELNERTREWELTSRHLGHLNHVVLSEHEAEEKFEREGGRKTIPIRKRRKTSHSNSPPPSQPPLNSSTSHPLPPPLSSSTNSTSPPTYWTIPFPPKLRAFLFSLHPTLSPHAEILFASGITSVKALVELVWMDEQAFVRLWDEVEELEQKEGMGINEVGKVLLRVRLGEARKKFEYCKA